MIAKIYFTVLLVVNVAQLLGFFVITFQFCSKQKREVDLSFPDNCEERSQCTSFLSGRRESEKQVGFVRSFVLHSHFN